MRAFIKPDLLRCNDVRPANDQNAGCNGDKSRQKVRQRHYNLCLVIPLEFMALTLSEYSSSPPLLSIRLEGGGDRLADLVDQLTLECCHSFRFYGSCRKRIPIRDSSMPKIVLSQCGVSSDVFIGLIVPTTCSSICWD